MIAHSSEEYREAVARALNGLDDDFVFNGTVDHARVVVEEAFKAARQYVQILSNRLSAVCYGSTPVTAAALAFLALNDSRIDILVEEPETLLSQREFLDAIQTAGGTRVRILQVPKALVGTYTFNFLTVDRRAFRFEADRTKPIAVVGGGASAKQIAEHLSSVFDDLFSRSAPLSLRLEPA